MKRFTETKKWEDPWFRSLSPPTKLLWLWLLDHCDIAGVIRADLQLASFQIGQTVDENNIAALGDRVAALPDGKLHIPKFIRFQFGELSAKSNVHQSVMRAVSLHGLALDKPSPSLGQALTLNQGLSRGCSTPKEKEKEKEKEPDRKGQENVNGELDPVFIRDLLAAYRRPAGSRLSYSEQSALAQIIRERPRYKDEWDTIIILRHKEPRYFPQSLSRLLSAWQDTLDRAMNWVPDARQPKTIADRLMKELDSIK